MTEQSTKVFISYSWDSEDHNKKVLSLADKLREESGLDAEIDKYVRSKAPFTPEQGWAIWMQDKIEWAEFVLIVCTETYKRRFDGKEEPGKGLGVSWEGRIINQHLYRRSENTKFIPIVFSALDLEYVPLILDSADKYIIDEGESYQDLCYRLKKLGSVRKPEIRNLDLEPPDLKKLRMTATNSYTILSLTDSSHGGAKRYSANILLNKDCSKADIAAIASAVTIELKTRQYYRNEQSKQRWQGREAQVVWLFIYLAVDDFDSVDWVCRTQWISRDLSPELSPTALDGRCVDGDIVLDWSESYGSRATWLSKLRVTKEDYLDSMNKVLDALKPLIYKTIELIAEFDLEQRLSEDEYVSCMSQLELRVKNLYLESGHIGVAPTECRDLSHRFQCVMTMAHNIVLPFSKDGLGTWTSTSRRVIVSQAIKGYQKDLQRLEFELEKVH